MSENNAVKIYDPSDDFAQMRTVDIIIPRLQLQQLTSPGVIDGRFKAGQFVIDGNDLAIDKDKSSRIVPIMFWLQWMEYNPDRNAPKDKRVLNKSFDPMSPLAKLAEAYKKVKNSDGKDVLQVTEYYNLVVALPDIIGYDELYIMGFAKSAHQTGKQWINRMRRALHPYVKSDKANMWMFGYNVSSKLEEKNGNKYFVPVIGDATPVPMEQFAKLAYIAQKIREQRQAIAEAAMASENGADEEVSDSRPDLSPNPQQAAKSGDRPPF